MVEDDAAATGDGTGMVQAMTKARTNWNGHSRSGEWTGLLQVCGRIVLMLFVAVIAGGVCQVNAATAVRKHHRGRAHVVTASRRVVARARRRVRSATQAAVLHAGASAHVRAVVARRRTRGRHVFASPWTEPTFADSTAGDKVDGEDLIVRKAAVDALGPYNGTVVVSDPNSGRILSMVNQKLALKGAFQPCSTVKVMVSLASLSEGIVNPGSAVRLTRRASMDMTHALATSNNMYFAHLGEELGFDRVAKYGKMFGLGEKAGLDIPGEEAGFLTDAAPTTGVGMMTSFGDGIRLTPLELTGLISTVATGGTLYYLQYPKNAQEVEKFVPRIKRTLDISTLTEEIRPGMMGAVEYGTARRIGFDPTTPIYGKTGTCTDTVQPGVHLGWFGSFTEVGKNRVSVVVLLTGGRGISGPVASGIAGNVYHNLATARYFEAKTQLQLPVQSSLVSFQGPSGR